MSRVYADNRQIVVLAKYMLSINELDAKAFLEPRDYQVKLSGTVYNFDYKLVGLAIYMLRNNAVDSKPKKSTRTKA